MLTSIIFLFAGAAGEYHYVFLRKTNWMTSASAQQSSSAIVLEIIIMQDRQTAGTAGHNIKEGRKQKIKELS